MVTITKKKYHKKILLIKNTLYLLLKTSNKKIKNKYSCKEKVLFITYIKI